MSSKGEFAPAEFTRTEKIPTVVATSHYLLKRGTAADEAIVTTAVGSVPIGRLNVKTTVANEAGEVQMLVPGQKLKLVTDGSLDAIGDAVIPDNVTPGRVKKGTPSAGDFIIGRAAEVDGAAGTDVLVDITMEGLYAAT